MTVKRAGFVRGLQSVFIREQSRPDLHRRRTAAGACYNPIAVTESESLPGNTLSQPATHAPARSGPAGDRLDRQVTRHTVTVPPGTRLEITIEARDPSGRPLGQQSVSFTNAAAPGGLAAPPLHVLWQQLRAGEQAAAAALLMAAAVIVYLAVRLIGLDQFPIYFFTDEAVQTVLAADLLRDGLKNYAGEWLPTYFINGGQYNLSLSVYLQTLPVLLLPRSAYVTRLIPMLVTLTGVFAVGRALQKTFAIDGWLGVLLLSLTPAWFLHSRTAFECALATSFYAGFLHSYLRYRQDSPRHLYTAVVFGSLAFYSYSPAQMVLAVTVLLLGLSDARYHWHHRKTVLRAAGLAALLALPYVRFQLTHPGETLRHLEILKSYWVLDLPLAEKFGRYFKEYGRGLNLLYWHLPDQGMMRHVMKGYGHLWRPALPFLLIGLGVAVWNVRRSEYRTLLIAMLAAPAGAALAGMGITRALFMVIPAALLTALGLAGALNRIEGWLARTVVPFFTARSLNLRPALAALVFLLLAGANLVMLRDALVNGPLWFRDYGLGDMQYGARQLFPAVEDYLHRRPEAKLVVSPTWANGTDVLARFFSGDPLPYQMGSITGYLDRYTPIDPQQVFVMTPEEYALAAADPKLTAFQVEQTLPYPDGRPGFYFVRLRYSDQAPELFAQEAEERRKLVEEETTLPDGQPIRAAYSAIDMGQIKDVFDGDPSTLIRTAEANPLRLAVEFPTPRTIQSVDVRIGGTPTQVTLRTCNADQGECREQVITAEETPHPRSVSFTLDEPAAVARVELEVLTVREGEPCHVHLWEVTFR